MIAKFINPNFHPLEAVPRLCSAQFQVNENYSDLSNRMTHFFES